MPRFPRPRRKAASPVRRTPGALLRLEALEDRWLPSVSVALYTNLVGQGAEELFVFGLDGQVYAQKLDAVGNSTGPYGLTQPGVVKAVSVVNVYSSASPIFLFAIGLDDQVYEQKFDGAGNSLGPYALTQPGQIKTVAAFNANGAPELFVVGLDDQVYIQQFGPSGNSSGPYTLSHAGQIKFMTLGFFALAPVGTQPPVNPELFAIGLDDQVYTQKFNASGTSAGGYALTRPGQVRSVSVGNITTETPAPPNSIRWDITPEMFAVGTDDQVYAMTFNSSGDPVSGYFLAAAGQVRAVGVGLYGTAGAVGANNPAVVFVQGLDDQVYELTFDGAGNPTGPYSLVSPGQVKTFTTSPVPRGVNGLFVVGLDDQLYEQRFDNDGVPSGNYFLTAPGQIQC